MDRKQKNKRFFVWSMCALFALVCFAISYEFAAKYFPRKMSFTVNNEVRVDMPANNYKLITTNMDATVCNDEGQYMSFVFLNSGYYDAFIEEVENFGYEPESWNGYTVYNDDEGYYYYIKLIGLTKFSYIYGNDREFIESALNGTDIYLVN